MDAQGAGDFSCILDLDLVRARFSNREPHGENGCGQAGKHREIQPPGRAVPSEELSSTKINSQSKLDSAFLTRSRNMKPPFHQGTVRPR